MLGAYDLLCAGVAFSVFLSGFLAGCAIILFVEDMSDDETQDAIALGGGSLAQELRRHATGPNPDHIETLHHGRKD